METPPTVISPRPGDGQIRGSTLSLRRPNPGRSQATAAILPGLPPQLAPGEYCEGGAPSLRRTRPTPTPTNTQLRKYWAARWIPRSAWTRRYAPAEPSGSWTRRGNPGGIWSEIKPAPYANPIDQIDPITQDGSRFITDNPEDSGGLTAGARAAVLRHSVETGAVVKVQGTVTAVDQAGAKSAVTGPWANQEDLLKDVSAAEISRLLGVSRTTVYRYLGPGWKRRTKAAASRPTSPRPVWPLRQAMTSQTNPHGWTGDPEARWGADFGDSAPAHRGFPGEHPPRRRRGGAGNVPRKTGAYRRPVHPP